MSDMSTSLFELVQSQLDKEGHAALHWEGSFQDYLTLTESTPQVMRNAWQRLLDMIESHGYEEAERRGGPQRWNLFNDPFDDGRDAVYGLDVPLAQLVSIIRAGAQGLGPERRVLLLHGPVGSAKSTIVRLLKRGLEEMAGWLTRELAFPQGVFLMTGTCLVPEDSFTLMPGDRVRIQVGNLVLENSVEG